MTVEEAQNGVERFRPPLPPARPVYGNGVIMDLARNLLMKLPEKTQA